jgi:hypothetical protein
MELNEIIKAMPPIILGFGGIVPALIVSSRSIFADAPKALLCTIMVLIVWIGYWAALMCWQVLLFNDWITLSFLIFTLLLLFWVFLGALPRGWTGASDGSATQEQVRNTSNWRRFLRRLVIPVETPKTVYLVAYILALTSVSIAAALYVGPKGRVIVKLDGPSHVKSVEVIWHKKPNPQPISHKRDRKGAKVVLTEEEFADANTFVIHTSADALWIADRSAARAVVNPGLGQRYVITAEQAK